MSGPAKDIANTIYHSAVTTVLVVGYSMIGKKMIKLHVGDPARPAFTDALKLTIVVTLATFTKDWSGNNKILPTDIINKT